MQHKKGEKILRAIPYGCVGDIKHESKPETRGGVWHNLQSGMKIWNGDALSKFKTSRLMQMVESVFI